MTFRPVCKGTETLFRVITPGATRSVGRVFLLSIEPCPSIACPSALTTRPRSSSPTGTSTICPVRFTASPSLISGFSPSNTTPTFSSSRFMTMPYTSCGKSRSSLIIALRSP